MTDIQRRGLGGKEGRGERCPLEMDLSSVLPPSLPSQPYFRDEVHFEGSVYGAGSP